MTARRLAELPTNIATSIVRNMEASGYVRVPGTNRFRKTTETTENEVDLSDLFDGLGATR